MAGIKPGSPRYKVNALTTVPKSRLTQLSETDSIQEAMQNLPNVDNFIGDSAWLVKLSEK